MSRRFWNKLFLNQALHKRSVTDCSNKNDKWIYTRINLAIPHSEQTIFRTKSPRYLFWEFLLLSEICVRDTKHGSSLLSIPFHPTFFYCKSLIVSSCRLWNNLPDKIRYFHVVARFQAEVYGVPVARACGTDGLCHPGRSKGNVWMVVGMQ